MMKKTELPINIVFADDHELIRNGFKAMLKRETSIHIIGEASNGKELLDAVERLQPQVVFTDIKMPVMNGIDATAIIHRDHPHIPVVALSMFDEEDLIMQMIDAGASGYILKNTRKEEIIEAAKRVYNHGVYFCNTISHKMINNISQSKFNHPGREEKVEFSQKEIEIIQLICQEFANKEIAGELNMSIRTVESYRDKIQQKIKAKNMAGIVVYAIRNGIYKLK